MFLGGFSSSVDREMIKKLFSKIIEVHEVEISTTKKTNASLCYGSLVANRKDADLILSKKKMVFDGVTFIALPYLQGDVLQKHHKDLKARRIILRSSFTLD